MVVSLHQTPTPQKTPTPTRGRRRSSLAKTTRRARSVVLVRCVFVLNRFNQSINPIHYSRERAFWRVFDGFGLYRLRPLRPGWSAFFFLNHTNARLDPPRGGGNHEEKDVDDETAGKARRRAGLETRFSRRLEGDKVFEEGCVDDYAAPVFLLSCALFLSFFLSFSLSFSVCVGVSLCVSLCVCFLR